MSCNDSCDHPGHASRPLNCPDCGRLSAHSWATVGGYGPDGWDQQWGGICKTHGHWSDSVA